MKRILIVGGFCSIFLFVFCTVEAQKPKLSDTIRVDALLEKSKGLIGNSPDSSIFFSSQAKELAQKLNYTKGVALALKNIGNAHHTQGNYIEAMQNWRQSMEAYRYINDLVGVSNILNNIGTFYSIQGDFEKALENYFSSLKYAEQTGNKERIASALINIGATFAGKPETYDKALSYYLKALPLTEETGNLNTLAVTTVNIGEVYSLKGNSQQALIYFQKSLKAYQDAKDDAGIPYAYNAIANEYRKEKQYANAIQHHKKALNTAEKVNNKLYIIQSLIGLASTTKQEGLLKESLGFYKRAEAIGREIGALNELKDVYEGLSAIYAQMNHYDNAFAYQTLFTNIKDTLYNIATDKKLDRMEFDFSLQKKQGEIDLLTKDKALKDLELMRERQANRAFMIVVALLLLIAFIIYRNYRSKVKINQLLDKQKERIEGLLLNILPGEVAKELQATGKATPKYYTNVSVLFSDFKNFTTLAEHMSPQVLVEELNHCFTAFDAIVRKHGLEKIKTIGDSYMCAGGIPVPNQDHPFRMVKAAIEIQEYILERNKERREKGQQPWEIRIGIHLGPVVAGVVGDFKYAYDIWGSTVNIASRMESNGAPGRINISSALYNFIKEKYACSYRGKIYAKNVGEIDMYFLEKEVKITSKEFQPDILLQ